MLPFRNDASETVPGFAVLRVVGVMQLEGQAVLRVEQPNGTYERLYYVNGPVPVALGEYGVCCAGQPAFVAYDTGSTPATGESWGAKDGEWKLFPHRPGFTLLGDAIDDDGPARVLVRQQEVTTLAGKLEASLSPGGSVTVSLWCAEPGSEVDSGLDVTAHDWLLRGETAALATGTKVVVTWLHGAWYVTEAQCPE